MLHARRFIALATVLGFSGFTTIRSLTADAAESWKWRAPLPQRNDLYSLAASHDTVITVGKNGVILRRTGADPWTVSSISFAANDLRGLAWTGDRFVAWSGAYVDFFQSADGAAWTRVTGLSGQTSETLGMAGPLTVNPELPAP